MKKLLIVLFLIALSVGAGWLWQKNQPQLLGERIEEQKREIHKIPDPQGLTVDEQIKNWNSNLVTFRQTAKAKGFSDEEINAEIERKINEWTPKLKELSDSEKMPPSESVWFSGKSSSTTDEFSVSDEKKSTDVTTEVVKNVCNCKGYDGPGGPCYSGPGGDAYDGPGGPAYPGPGGPCYDGPGGPEYSGAGGPKYSGPGGPAYDGPGGPCYDGPGGPCYSGPGGGSSCPSVCR